MCTEVSDVSSSKLEDACKACLDAQKLLADIQEKNLSIKDKKAELENNKLGPSQVRSLSSGMEAMGVVIVVGPGLTDWQVGDGVAYALNPMGSYAEEQLLPSDRVVLVPSSIDPSFAASVFLKGMTAQFHI
ncbi:GroES-like zinc-binding alcohol dehydrogenase family protein [Tanacetum coccineum]